MPKPAARADASRPKRGKKAPAKRRTSSPKTKKTNGATHPAKGRPTIIPAQSVHHGTPPVVAEGIVYPVLGDPVDLDPCSNEQSIIRARRKVILPEDGLAIPWFGNVYVNPPYGMPEILEWIRKIVVEHQNNGAQVIALLPGHTSSEWFDLVAATARACFLWGPGLGNRRLKFIGNKESAAFHSVVAYWGADLPLFTRYALRYCHPWFPEHDLRLARALVGDGRLPEGPAVSLAQADELLTLARNDDLACALTSLGSATLGDILDAGDSLLLGRLREVCAYELGAALLYASRTNGKAWLDRRIPKIPQRLDPRQLDLLALQAPVDAPPSPPAPAPPSVPRTLDDMVYDEVSRGTDNGPLLTAQDLRQRCDCNPAQLRSALRRLRKAEKIDKTGRTQGARYFATKEQEQEQIHGQ